jgi:hypothetical protein
MQQPRVRCSLAVAPALALAPPRVFSDNRCCVPSLLREFGFLFWSLRVNFLFDFESIRNPSAFFVFLFHNSFFLRSSVCEL